MKKFIVKTILFIIPILMIIFLGSLFDKSNEEVKIDLFNKVQKQNNIIIIGDSKTLVDLDYAIIKDNFPNYSIINLSLWARNPKYIYSVYKDVFKNKQISNSIIVYNLTFRHILNRDNNEYEKLEKIYTPNLKNIIKTIINRRYSFKYNKDKNGFIQIKGQKFGTIKDGKLWYKELEKTYSPNFHYQLSYVDSIRLLFNSTNTFIVSEFPHDKILDSIYKKSEYYKIFKNEIKRRFKNPLYFGYLKELDNSEYWYNRDHLNIKGVSIFTPLFVKRMNEYIRTHNNVYKSLGENS